MKAGQSFGMCVCVFILARAFVRQFETSVWIFPSCRTSQATTPRLARRNEPWWPPWEQWTESRALSIHSGSPSYQWPTHGSSEGSNPAPPRMSTCQRTDRQSQTDKIRQTKSDILLLIHHWYPASIQLQLLTRCWLSVWTSPLILIVYSTCIPCAACRPSQHVHMHVLYM